MSLRITLRLSEAFDAENDRALVSRFVESRDEAAFAGLVNRHARMVLGVCKRAVQDVHLAEDAFQAVFLVLARNPRQAARASSVGGWLFGIARRVGWAARRHEERRRQRELRSAPPPTDRDPDFDDLLRVLDEELSTLPDAYRASLVACFLEERTQDEAARQLGWSLSTLRRRVERGKELLRARLLRRGVALAAGLFAGALAPSAHARVRPDLLASVLPSTIPSAEAAKLAAKVATRAIAVKTGIAALVMLAALGWALGYGPWNESDPVVVVGGDREMANVAVSVSAPTADASERWVAVSGRVLFPRDRAIPKPRVVAEGTIKDRAFFAGEVVEGDLCIDPVTRGIADVMVWLRPDTPDVRDSFPRDRIHPRLAKLPPMERVIETGRDGFRPRVTAARIGDRLVFNNPNPIPFNVHYHPVAAVEGEESGELNVLLPAGKRLESKPVPILKGPANIEDRIHHWMRGFVLAFDHPYVAVTDERGAFLITDVPEGTWRLVIWHEKAGYGAAGRIGITVNASAGTTPTTIVLESNW